MAHDVTDFEREVLERSHTLPVLVDFWAEWCGPCRALGPVLENLARGAAGRWELAKVDTEALPEVSARYAVQSIPSVKLFVNGEVTDGFVGALPERDVSRWLEAALPSPVSGELSKAIEQLEAGAFAEAAAGLRAVVAAEPSNVSARFVLGRALLHAAPAEVEAAVSPLGEDSDDSDRAAALATLALAVVRSETPGEWPESPGRPRLIEAMRAVRTADWAAAMEALIALMRLRNDPAAARARELGRAIFVLLGFEHPVCEHYHRAFSNALNV